MLKKKSNAIVNLLLFTMFSILISIIISYCFLRFNIWPKGNDVWGHLFKADFLLDEIKKGNYFPIINPYWYNGMELFRYWPPLSYYIIAFISLLTNFNIITSSVVFLGVCIFISIFGFLLLGYKENKLFVSFIIGIVYIFMPHNTEIMLFEGNLPRLLISALLPLTFFFVVEVIQYHKRYAYPCIMICFVIITYTHIMISAMVGISLLLYCLCFSIVNKKFKEPILVIVATILSYLLTLPILIPGLFGGILTQTSTSSIETINTWSQNGFLSLDILKAYDINIFYFGIMFFLICTIGIITWRKEIFSGFFVAIIIFFGTTESFLPIVRLMPFSQVFWMRRFVPMAYALGLIAFLQWKKIKHSFLYFFILLLVIDSCLRFAPFCKNNNVLSEDIEHEESMNLLVDDVIQNTDNRFGLIDLSSTSSYQSYQTYKTKTKFAFGWSYQGAIDMIDIMAINEAFEYGHYGYSFTRLVILGCDSLAIKKDCFPNANWDEVLQIANSIGYVKKDENASAIRLKLDNKITGEYGTKTTYKNLAIGNSSYYISYIYPNFGFGNSVYLDDYSIEELSNYEKIYLAGFSYHDKEKAESIIKELANKGIKVFIDCDSFKEDKTTRQREFLNVYAQPIEFTKNFPIITVVGKPEFLLSMTTKDYSTWRTTYLSNVANVTGASYYGDKILAYLGTDETKNITFIGYNLIYYCINGDNEQLNYWLDITFNEKANDLPNITYYPIKTTYDNDTIIIETNEDNINTNIAWFECFKNQKGTTKDGNFLVIDKGNHVLSITWPFYKISIFLSIIGFILCTSFCICIIFKRREQ